MPAWPFEQRRRASVSPAGVRRASLWMVDGATERGRCPFILRLRLRFMRAVNTMTNTAVMNSLVLCPL